MIRLELTEYGECPVDLDDRRFDALLAAAGNRLGVRRRAGGGHVLTAGPHVGVLVAGDVQVSVRPKVELHNLLLLLGVGQPAFSSAVGRFRRDEDLLAAMARVFAHAVEDATVRGVLRGYRHTQERLVAPRGRIDIAAQLRRPAVPSPVACRFDEYTADVLENRALLAAIDRLRRIPGLATEHRARLVHLAHRFAEVAAVPVDPAAVERWVPNRLNRHYEVALRLAALVLRNVTLRHPGAGDDDVRGPSFLVNMNDLFQDYVAARLARALHGRLDVVAEPKVHLGAGGRLAMRPDLTFRRPGGRGRDPCVYVGDVKYKLASGPARLSDYYQLLAYATALGLDDGVLVYAQRPDPGAATASEDSEIADDLGDEPVHTVRIVNTSTRLHVYRLPLTGTNAQVEAGVDQLAEWILRRVPRSTAISA